MRAVSSCPPTGFLPAIAAWAKENGALLIADEIQTGFCRTGAWFASDHEGVVPDLITRPRASPAGCRWPPSPVARRSWTPSTRVASAAPTAATRSPARPRSARSRTMRELDLVGAAKAIETTMKTAA